MINKVFYWWYFWHFGNFIVFNTFLFNFNNLCLNVKRLYLAAACTQQRVQRNKRHCHACYLGCPVTRVTNNLSGYHLNAPMNVACMRPNVISHHIIVHIRKMFRHAVPSIILTSGICRMTRGTQKVCQGRFNNWYR